MNYPVTLSSFITYVWSYYFFSPFPLKILSPFPPLLPISYIFLNSHLIQSTRVPTYSFLGWKILYYLCLIRRQSRYLCLYFPVTLSHQTFIHLCPSFSCPAFSLIFSQWIHFFLSGFLNIQLNPFILSPIFIRHIDK